MTRCGMNYPTEIPVDCVREIIRIVRDGKLLTERANFARHAWNVQGYLQRVLLGEPQGVIGETGPLEDASALAALAVLEPPAAARAEEFAIRALPVPVSLLLRWLIEKLIESLLGS